MPYVQMIQHTHTHILNLSLPIPYGKHHKYTKHLGWESFCSSGTEHREVKDEPNQMAVALRQSRSCRFSALKTVKWQGWSHPEADPKSPLKSCVSPAAPSPASQSPRVGSRQVPSGNGVPPFSEEMLKRSLCPFAFGMPFCVYSGCQFCPTSYVIFFTC